MLQPIYSNILKKYGQDKMYFRQPIDSYSVVDLSRLIQAQQFVQYF